MQYAAKNFKKHKKSFSSLMYYSVNKCTTSLFRNNRTRLIHDNTSTPSLLAFNIFEIHVQVSVDASFRVIVFG